MSNSLMNLSIDLPVPLNPPFPDRPALNRLGAVHFVGIGGAGMSAIARLMLAAGMTVSGSDQVESAAVSALRELGARVSVPQAAENLDGVDTVVVSTAIRDDNPELAGARERGLRVLHRSEALAATMCDSQVIAVAGTHGKTTTSSMIAVMLGELGLDPSFAVGSTIAGYNTNAHLGAGGEKTWFVAEADESDGSFVRYRPEIAVITNAEPDHLDFYGSSERVFEAFNRFIASMAPGGVFVTCLDDSGAAHLVARVAEAGVQVVTYGEGENAMVRLTGITSEGTACSSNLVWNFTARGQEYAGHITLTLKVPGVHNQLNATASFICALIAGASPEAAATALGTFGGTDRRFTLRGEVAGVKVFDDYAHHPTEVQRALETGRTVASGHNLYVIFQPHLFSRTQEFAAEFAQALAQADRTYVLDIYPAREAPIEGVTSRLITEAGYSEVHYAKSAEEAVEAVVAAALPGDIVMTVGAGDVTSLGRVLVEKLAIRTTEGATN
ncbi:UDP-N-acetylmuramate--L-alanine ligase [Rothia nasimurium]|uniref:UDP-N-acetylmuramate--L-alanine ligase n=1 Tax=Rothia nasimurium TaxID=85336 RepID=A0A1Y1RPT2_9MICC|nr:UDP-N-acetylmuramate--L-alanine ligase [Rothia nasimurium]ORC18912.1 UDP-N-acetylmuramate--L-alanine ligase [Rothia nasimurium]